MPNQLRDLREVFIDKENSLVFEKNVSIPLKDSDLPVRCNVYRNLGSEEGKKYPVLVTYGPYGKDIWYGDFHPKSFGEVSPEQKSKYSAWETPDPVYWTRNEYAVVRVDERGLGQSPGILDTMSRGTSEAFFDVVEWAARQPWSSGKVGLLGVSYYAGSQWRVAARRPQGLAAIIPWEGMSDYYRDRCRHGGILSNGFIKYWWNRQVVTNQYGRPGRAAAKWGGDTIEGNLSPEELNSNCRDQTVDNEMNRYRDDDYYASKEFALEDIEVPLLSVANWGGIVLHLRGNVHGYMFAGSKYKFLRFIVGRHDLPFYYPEEVEIQRSFLDAFLKDQDAGGWTTGEAPPISLCLRKEDVGWNDPQGEAKFLRRTESEWPIQRTKYTKYFLDSAYGLCDLPAAQAETTKVSYQALGSLESPQLVQFCTSPFASETEITGHIVAHLNVSLESEHQDPGSLDMDLFLTMRYISPEGKEVFYTGSAGDAVPLCKGWLRLSLRKARTDHPRSRSYLPYREYLSTDVQEVKNNEIYAVDVELWPTNVVVQEGGKLVLEVSSGDTQGAGVFKHTSPVDRPADVFAGKNHLHFGVGLENFLTLPIIPVPAQAL